MEEEDKIYFENYAVVELLKAIMNTWVILWGNLLLIKISAVPLKILEFYFFWIIL